MLASAARRRIPVQRLLAVDLDYRAGLAGNDDKPYPAPKFVECDGTTRVGVAFRSAVAAAGGGSTRLGFRLAARDSRLPPDGHPLELERLLSSTGSFIVDRGDRILSDRTGKSRMMPGVRGTRA